MSTMEEDALGWVVDFTNTAKRGIHLSKTELERFETWLTADPRHPGAYADAKRQWDALNSLPGVRWAIEQSRKRRQQN